MSAETIDGDLLGKLAEVFAAKQTHRERRARTALLSMTVRERRLVREAAVMGYVQGVRHGPHRDKIPGDSAIVVEVLIACDAFCDLYPFLSTACDGKRKRGPRTKESK